MLVSYSISNFKSIKLEQTINFKAKPLKRNKNLPERKLLDDEILPVIGIYGPNGGGKTSILESFVFLIDFINCNDNDVNLKAIFEILTNRYKYFDSKNKDSCWTLILKINDMYYKYKLCLSNTNITYEELSKTINLKNNWKIIFKRKNNEMEFSQEIKKSKIKFDSLKGTLLSFLYSRINIEDISIIYNNIIDNTCLINSLKTDKNPQLFYNEQKIKYDFDVNFLISNKKLFLKIFNDIDLNIVDIDLKKDIFGNELLILKKNSNSTNKEELLFEFESDGTKRIIYLLLIFVESLINKNNSIFIIDELDSRLHPKLLGYIIDLFNSENNKHSQLIFTSHDMYTLDKKYFRKDEVYFAALNESYFTDVVCLNDFNDIRDSTSYSNKYLSGSLGYDPYIKKVEKW